MEKELLRACTDGDLETVKRLSSRIAVRNVHDHQFDNEDGPLHKAARYDNVYVLLNIMSLCIHECTVQVIKFHMLC